MISKLLKGTRIGAAAILPAAIMFWVASDDIGGYDAPWFDYLVPIALVAVFAVGCLDGLRGVVPAALCCGVIFAIAAHIEQDDQPLPQCNGFKDMRACKHEASPQGGFPVAIMVFLGGGVAALIAYPFKKHPPWV